MTTPETRCPVPGCDGTTEPSWSPGIVWCRACGWHGTAPAPPTTGAAGWRCPDCNWKSESMTLAIQHGYDTHHAPAVWDTGAAAGAMSDERLAEIRRNLLEKGWRPTRDETAALFDYIDRLRSSPASAADGALRDDDASFRGMPSPMDAAERDGKLALIRRERLATGALREAAERVLASKAVMSYCTAVSPEALSDLAAAVSRVPSSVAASGPEHVCGLQGFGMGIDDRCPACEAAAEQWRRDHPT